MQSQPLLTVSPHSDSVADANSVEGKADEALLFAALLHLEGEIELEQRM